jgi:NAD-dependent dihydropyrimidine dehydrogenase PreA subunit
MHVISDECVKCGSCAGACPTGAIEEGETKYVVTDACIDCGSCESVCPTGAISAAPRCGGLFLYGMAEVPSC